MRNFARARPRSARDPLRYRGGVLCRFGDRAGGMDRDCRGAGAGRQDRRRPVAAVRLLASLPLADRVGAYLDIFCTATDRTPRKTIVSKAVKDASLAERLNAEQTRVCALLDRLRAVICRDRSAALVRVAHAVLTRFHDEKARRGLLDYDDLIDKALALLTSIDAAWVHYKLDFGIDHLLIDEAQDTSRKQWQIVLRLVAEFTAGAGARNVTRTIFAVGDEKQSIYSFQNAAPKEFAEMRRHFERAHSAIGLGFVPGRLEHSFRSGESILAAVDLVFAGIAAQRHVGPGWLSAAHRLARCAARHGGNLGADRARRAPGDRRLGRAVRYGQRDQSARKARATHRPHGAEADRRRRAGRHRSPCRELRRRFDPGAPARRIVRGDHSRLEERKGRGCRRRPAGADRAYRGHGSHRACRCAAAAGGRSRARNRAAQPAVRFQRRRPVRRRLGSRPARRCALRSSAKRRSGEIFADADARIDALRKTPGARRRLRSMRNSLAPAARGGVF